MRIPIKVSIIHLLIVISLSAFALSARKPSVGKVADIFYPCSEIDFMWAVAEAESGHDPKSRYVESNGEISGGLYQMSVGDSHRYGCDFKTEVDLYDPKKNTDCAVKAMALLRQKYSGGYQLVLGKYWAVLRGPDWGKQMRPTAWNNFKKAALKRGCVIP